MSSIRCHTVPQFYLKYFLPLNSSLFWVYDKRDSSLRAQPPINTAVISDYYLSSPDKEGNEDQGMEKFFSVLEGMAKPIFDTWISDPSKWQEDDKLLIATFLSFMHTRAPRTIGAVKEIGTAGIDYCLSKLRDVAKDKEKSKKLYEGFCASEEGKDCKVSFEEFSQLMSDPLKYASIHINEKHAIGDSFLVSDTMFHILMSMHWGIAHIDEEHFFVTNDAPVNIFVPTDGNTAIFGGGIGLPKAEVSFPLSPKLCLQMKHTPMNRYYRVYANFVDEINKRSVFAAERYVISPFKSNEIHKIIKELVSTYGKPKMDTEEIRQKFKDADVGGNL